VLLRAPNCLSHSTVFGLLEAIHFAFLSMI